MPGQEVDAPAQGADPVDGRAARAARTRAAIVDATVALVDEGDLRPTGPRIAERAGVSVRSIFQHFDDLDSLFTAIGGRQLERIMAVVAPIDPAAGSEARRAELVRQRCRINELASPMNRAAMVHAPTSATIGSMFSAGNRAIRDFVAAALAPEMAAAGDRQPALLDLVAGAVGWPQWNVMRSVEGRSVEEATAAVAAMVDLALDAVDA